MALISLFSAKGAPGVTSTAMLVAALWPRETLLVDADGNGGDVALRLLSPTGAALTRNPGLLTLLPVARHGISAAVIREHTQVAMGGQRVIVGLENPAQAEASAALWPVLAQGFRDIPDTDIVIDVGQVSSRSGQLALLQHSDVAIAVMRAEAPSVVHVRQRMRWLTDALAPLGAEAPRLGMTCLEEVSRKTEASAAVSAVSAEVAGLLDLGQVALDRKAVRMFHGELIDRPERTMLVRSGRALVERLVGVLGPIGEPDEPVRAEQPEPTSRAESRAESRRRRRNG